MNKKATCRLHNLIEKRNIFQVYFFIGHLVIAYTAAYVISVSFEAPIMGIEKLLFEPFMHQKRAEPQSEKPVVSESMRSEVNTDTTDDVMPGDSEGDDVTNGDSLPEAEQGVVVARNRF